MEFNYGYQVKYLTRKRVDRKIQLEAMIDINVFINAVSKDDNTKTRFHNYVLALRKSFVEGELSRIACILGKKNLEDELTKPILTKTAPLF